MGPREDIFYHFDKLRDHCEYLRPYNSGGRLKDQMSVRQSERSEAWDIRKSWIIIIKLYFGESFPHWKKGSWLQHWNACQWDFAVKQAFLQLLMIRLNLKLFLKVVMILSILECYHQLYKTRKLFSKREMINQ